MSSIRSEGATSTSNSMDLDLSEKYDVNPRAKYASASLLTSSPFPDEDESPPASDSSELYGSIQPPSELNVDIMSSLVRHSSSPLSEATLLIVIHDITSISPKDSVKKKKSRANGEASTKKTTLTWWEQNSKKSTGTHTAIVHSKPLFF